MSGPPTLLDRVNHFRAEADAWRFLAKDINYWQQKALLWDLAEEHERLAYMLEQSALRDKKGVQLMSATLRWHFDEFSRHRAGGWIDDNGPVDLTLVVNGKPVATTPADTYREDLEKAGIGDGRRAFTFELSTYLTRQHNSVSVLYNDIELQSSTFSPVDEEARLAAVVKEAAVIQSPQTSIRFLQTADASNYRKFLQLTSRTVMEYCERHDLTYDLHLGVCRGSRPWHATYNRIVLLRRILASGYAGWVCYLDADAFVADLDFNLRAYLFDKDRVALIISTDQPYILDQPYWSVNAGTFLINLGHPVGQDIVWRWAAKLDALSEILSNENSALPEWHGHVDDDQMLLIEILKTIAPEYVLVTRGDPNLINYGQGIFIRQILRSSLDERMAIIQSETDRVMRTAVP